MPVPGQYGFSIGRNCNEKSGRVPDNIFSIKFESPVAQQSEKMNPAILNMYVGGTNVGVL